MINLNIIHITRLRIPALAITATVVLSGCQNFNYKEMAYSALRHNDCQRNEVEVFCTRYYRQEYFEYERTRDELLKKNKETTGNASWTVSKDESVVL